MGLVYCLTFILPHLQTLRARRNLDNDIPDDVVESLAEGVRTKGVELARRYYTLKKEILRKTQGLTVSLSNPQRERSDRLANTSIN